MSKTYRDMVRGRLRVAQVKFEADDKYHEMVWRRYYAFSRIIKTGVRMFDPASVRWHQVRQVKPSYKDKTPWDLLSYKEELMVFPGFSKNPSWWNRLYGTKPNRRHERDLLKQYLGTKIMDRPDLDEKFYGRVIHCDYYW